MDYKEATLSWLHATTDGERLDFIRDIFKCVPLQQFAAVKNLVANAVKRKKATTGKYLSKKERKRDDCQVVGPTVQEAPAFPRTPASSCTVEEMEVQTVDEAPAFPGTPASSSTEDEEKGWWLPYGTKRVIAFDCEMIRLIKDPSNKMRLATITICNYKKEVIYEAKVKYEVGSFVVNTHTTAVNGFEENSFEDGTDFDKVVAKVLELFSGKLIITFGGFNDFNCMELAIADFDTFDLSSHFTKKSGQKTRSGLDVYQSINLRSLIYHYTLFDIHQSIHNSTVDAIATMELFKIYVNKVKTTNKGSRIHFNENDEFAHIERLK